MPDEAPNPSEPPHEGISELEFRQQRRLIDAHSMLGITDRDGKLLEVNELFCKHSGYSREELVGSPSRILSSEYHPAAFWDAMWSRISSGKTWCGEIRNRRKDGSIYWVVATIIPLKSSGGRIDAFATIQNEITGRKETEARLERARSLLEETSEVANVGGWEVDLETNRVFWSKITKRIHEVPDDFEPDLASGIQFYKKGESRRRIETVVSRAIEEGLPWDEEMELVTATGRVIWVRAKGKPVFRDGKCVRLYGTFQDVSSLRREREQLRGRIDTLYNTISSATDFSIIATDPDGLITVFSKGAEQMLGYREDEMVGLQTPAVIHCPDEVRQRARQLSQQLGSEVSGFETFVVLPRLRGSEKREWSYLRKDGSRLPVSLTVTPIREQDGRLTGYLGIAQDLSENKRIEERRRQSELRFEGAFSNNGMGMALVGPDGRWLEVNQSLCDIIGYDKETLLALTFQDITHPDDLDADLALLNEAIDGRRDSYSMQKRYFHRLGHVIWINLTVSLVRDAEGRPLYFVSLIEDITENKELEEELKTVSERLSMAIKAGRVGIWDWNIASGALAWDEQMFALYGLHPEDFSGAFEDWRRRLHPADAERAVQEVTQALDSGKDFDSRFRILTPDGETRHLRATGKVELDPHGKPARMLGINWDMTELARKQQLLEEKTVELRQASEAKSEFLANMSHEIRTPMNGIIGMTNLLLESDGLSPEQRRYGEIVKSSSESLLSLINDILDVSKVEAGQLELEELDFTLRSTLDDFASILSYRARAKGLNFSCSVHPNVPDNLIGDPSRLRQILVNLAGNAIKFTENGSVAVQAELLEQQGRQATLKFTVTDTGIGIKPDALPRLFDKFTQADNSTTRLFGGTGLGLAISKQLANLMGGAIGADSEIGQGSRFWFTASFALPDPKRQLRARAKTLRGARILLVHDHAEHRDLVLECLESWSVETIVCQDGPSALKELYLQLEREEPVAAAIIDETLPGMDGHALARAIKADPALQSVHLVLLSEQDAAPRPESDQRSGFNARCAKPARPSNLFDALAVALDPSRQSQAKVLQRQVERFAQTKARILVAEDNVVNQTVARGILERLGLRVEVVANGAEAVHALETLPYDLVLMDVQMPEMDGLSATRLIREREAKSGRAPLPIIAMTAHARREDKLQCLDAGMSDYVAKPVSAEALADALDRWLADPRPTEGPPQSAPPVRASRSPDFDPSDLLARVMSDQALMREILEASIPDLSLNCQALLGALSDQAVEDATRLSHAVKGSANNAGFVQLGQLAAAIEEHCQRGSLREATALSRRMTQSMDAALAAAQRYLKAV